MKNNIKKKGGKKKKETAEFLFFWLDLTVALSHMERGNRNWLYLSSSHKAAKGYQIKLASSTQERVIPIKYSYPLDFFATRSYNRWEFVLDKFRDDNHWYYLHKMTKWLDICIYNFKHRYHHESRKCKDAISLSSEDFWIEQSQKVSCNAPLLCRSSTQQPVLGRTPFNKPKCSCELQHRYQELH